MNRSRPLDPRRINLALWTAAAVAAATGLPAAWYGFAASVLPSDAPARPSAARPTATPAGGPAVLPPDAFGDTLTRTYRPTLTAATAGGPAPPTATADAAPSAPPADLRLVGTVGDSTALIRGPDGTTALVEVGDDVDGAVVVAIGPSRVDLRRAGRLTTLRKPPPPPPTGGDLGIP